MAKTINEQIVELQSENDRLKKLQKLFEKAVKDEFGVDTKTIHKKLGNSSDFEAKITASGTKTKERRRNFYGTIDKIQHWNRWRNQA